MSELTHQGAFRLIYKRRRTEAERGALQSHLQHCAECRQDAEMAGMFNDHLVLKELPTRPSPRFSAVYREQAARRSRRSHIMKPIYAVGGTVALALIVLAGWFIVRANPQTANLDEELILAATAGETIKVERLLSNGADPNVRDSEGNSLLPLAAMTGQTEIVRQLLEQGADANITMKPSGSGKTALMQAAVNNRSEIVDLLVANGADVNQTESDSGYSALHFAAQASSETIVKTLLENGADPNLQARDGRAPLHIAAKLRFFEIAEELLTNGANIDLLDNEGLTPMIVSIIGGRDAFIADTVRFLLHNGADPNRQDSNGSSALHHAVLANRIDTIPVLMEYGVSLDLKNNNGQTALDVAPYDIIREILREAGASE